MKFGELIRLLEKNGFQLLKEKVNPLLFKAGVSSANKS